MKRLTAQQRTAIHMAVHALNQMLYADHVLSMNPHLSGIESSPVDAGEKISQCSVPVVDVPEDGVGPIVISNINFC